MDLETIRTDVREGRRLLRITTHAQVETFKEGLLLIDLRYAFEHGVVIETYVEEARLLLYCQSQDGRLPVHLVIEDVLHEVAVITAYIPEQREWRGFTRRIRRRRQ